MLKNYLSPEDTKRVRIWRTNTAKALRKADQATDQANGDVFHDEYASVDRSEPHEHQEREVEPAVAINEATEGDGMDLSGNHKRWNKAKNHLKKGAKVDSLTFDLKCHDVWAAMSVRHDE